LTGPGIIAERSARARSWLRGAVVLAAALLGTAAALHYAQLDLTLSHYDARAHLMVARRVFDSLTPGWRQLGGAWLPLPHLLDLLPMVSDWCYRTGASAVVLSIAALAWGLGALAVFIYRHTGSVVAAVTAPALVLASPDVLYLQSTPMTEPLLFGCAFDFWARIFAFSTSASAWLPPRRPRHLKCRPSISL